MALGGLTIFDFDSLIKKYSKAKSNVVSLVRMGATVLHGVDATRMKLHTDLSMRDFDRIIFNFPHAGFHGKENENRLIKSHRQLVQGFFRCSSQMLRPFGEVHVSHKTSVPYNRWNLEELASKCSLKLIECVNFEKDDFPGYRNKRGDGPRCDEPFRLGECCTFKFSLNAQKLKRLAEKSAYAGPPLVHTEATTVTPAAPLDYAAISQAHSRYCKNDLLQNVGFQQRHPIFSAPELFATELDILRHPVRNSLISYQDYADTIRSGTEYSGIFRDYLKKHTDTIRNDTAETLDHTAVSLDYSRYCRSDFLLNVGLQQRHHSFAVSDFSATEFEILRHSGRNSLISHQDYGDTIRTGTERTGIFRDYLKKHTDTIRTNTGHMEAFDSYEHYTDPISATREHIGLFSSYLKHSPEAFSRIGSDPHNSFLPSKTNFEIRIGEQLRTRDIRMRILLGSHF